MFIHVSILRGTSNRSDSNESAMDDLQALKLEIATRAWNQEPGIVCFLLNWGESLKHREVVGHLFFGCGNQSQIHEAGYLNFQKQQVCNLICLDMSRNLNKLS